jgi:transcriptional regulator GlxA family with amidase domain
MAEKVGNSSLPPSPVPPRIENMAQRTVLFVLFDGMQSLDVTGPLEVFAGAEQHTPGTYRIRTASLDGAPVRTSSGLIVVPDETLAQTDAPHTLVVPGGQGTRRPDAHLTDWLREHGPRAERLVSVCTGAIRLAEAGLLDGRRVTTHWAYSDKLARDHPAVEVDPDPIYVRDGQVSTSAGVTSGIDLALALVEEDLGRDAALTIARHLVVFLRRPGNQAQFSAQLQTQVADIRPVRELQQYIADHPDADLSLAALAARLHMSPRHFGRVFCQQVGMSPGRYVERIRLETARRRLEESDHSVESVAQAAGFGSTETMRRVFVANLAVSPTDYRRRFGRGNNERGDSQ